MKLKISRTNIQSRLTHQRNKQTSEESLLQEVCQILQNSGKSDEAILKSLQEENSEVSNEFIFDELESDRIYHIDQIYKICVDYRLRF